MQALGTSICSNECVSAYAFYSGFATPVYSTNPVYIAVVIAIHLVFFDPIRAIFFGCGLAVALSIRFALFRMVSIIESFAVDTVSAHAIERIASILVFYLVAETIEENGFPIGWVISTLISLYFFSMLAVVSGGHADVGYSVLFAASAVIIATFCALVEFGIAARVAWSINVIALAALGFWFRENNMPAN